MADEKKRLKTARSKAEVIRTIVGICQLIATLVTLALVLRGQGLLDW